MKIYNIDNDLVELDEIIDDIFNERIGERLLEDEDCFSAHKVVKYGFNYFIFYESILNI